MAQPWPVNLAPNHPDLDTQTIRSYYRQCQKCWKRKADGVKLMVCSKCKIASYCVSRVYSISSNVCYNHCWSFLQSLECQKADWNFHKQACNTNQRHRELMAEEDALERLARHMKGETDIRPTNTEVNEEMGEFLRRFRPIICQASYRCLEVQKGASDAWKKYVFIVRIERIPKSSKKSKPWSRYKVVDAYKESIDEIKASYGHQIAPTLEQGEVYHKENVGVGCVGTIMTFLRCSSTGNDIQLISWAGYGENAWDDDALVPNWEEELIRSVEKICGRIS
ncbi:hypothetical protein BDY19DRAFT_750843 [Irpex rosettiformis]|uniref:Uncharacterized protein n=1 Tax=Irpex rosettiformis TaxID=378272 RepID=A0ACB8U799_9APHY|nr:hypothetical protein BDY19DRAFT_750843 [Irpex rosettiformis]